MNLHLVAIPFLMFCAFCGPARADTFGSGDNEFEIAFVTIGHPGNRADPAGLPGLAGDVSYVYNLGKYEISRDMIDKANASAELGITLHSMDFVTGGARPDMPATGVSWNEAARFVNWMNTSRGFPVAYKFAAQPGAPDYHVNSDIILWDEGDAGYDSENRFRNSQAHYFLPSTDEWYKAAYYDPNARGGAGGYFHYPYGSYAEPIPVASGTEPGTAVFAQKLEQGPADVTQAGGLSPLGVMALGGNVWEWEESEVDLTNDDPRGLRAARGGRWLNLAGALNSWYRDDDDVPTNEFLNLGFRVASKYLPIAGDANADGVVGFADFLAVSSRFGMEGNGWSEGDFDLDGTIGFGDFLILGQNYGNDIWGAANSDSPLSPTAVPEPSGILLSMMAAIVAVGSHRRRQTGSLARRHRVVCQD